MYPVNVFFVYTKSWKNVLVNTNKMLNGFLVFEQTRDSKLNISMEKPLNFS